MMLYSRSDGHVTHISTCCRIWAGCLRALLSSFLRSAGDHRSIPTSVATFKMWMASDTIPASIGSSRAKASMS
eukprot:5630938-Karenia_brevis.AAC.1